MIDNLINDLPESLPDELVDVLAKNAHVRIERIVSTGHRSPEGFWYEQDQHEWVALLKGQATLAYQNGREVHLKPGDQILIPAQQKHRVQSTSEAEPTVWLAVFFD